MTTFLTIIHVFACVFLVGIVPLQSGKAGGMGVLGAAGFTPEQLRQELDWISARLVDQPFGIDVIAAVIVF